MFPEIKKPASIALIAYAIIGALVINFRYRVLSDFGFVFTDSDQNIMWGALKDYAEGKFYEPRFYGQAYNSFLEAALAVPLYHKGLPPYIALPLITNALSIFPFFLLSFLTLIRRSYFHALLIISIPLLLPIQYSFLSVMPRGFVTGLFIASIGCIPVFFEKNKFGFLAAGFLSVLAFSVNSNAVLLSAPCLLYLFLKNFNTRLFYFYVGAGVIAGLALHLLTQYFYLTHPSYNLHRFVLEFSFENLFRGMSNSGNFLNFNSPLLHSNGLLFLLIFPVISIYFFYQKEYAKAVAVFIIPALIILTLGLNKVHEGTKSLFFHQARMYLPIPVLLAFSLSLFKLNYQPLILYLWILVPYQYYNSLIVNLETSVEQAVKPTNEEVVIVTKNQFILKDCKYLSTICKEQNVDLLVIVNHFYADAYASGCSSCFDDFPNTLKSNYERRTWRMIEDEGRVYNTVMFIDMFNKIGEGNSILQKIEGSADLYLAKNNSMKTFKLLDTLAISYRQFR